MLPITHSVPGMSMHPSLYIQDAGSCCNTPHSCSLLHGYIYIIYTAILKMLQVTHSVPGTSMHTSLYIQDAGSCCNTPHSCSLLRTWVYCHMAIPLYSQMLLNEFYTNWQWFDMHTQSLVRVCVVCVCACVCACMRVCVRAHVCVYSVYSVTSLLSSSCLSSAAKSLNTSMSASMWAIFSLRSASSTIVFSSNCSTRRKGNWRGGEGKSVNTESREGWCTIKVRSVCAYISTSDVCKVSLQLCVVCMMEARQQTNIHQTQWAVPTGDRNTCILWPGEDPSGAM